MATAQTLLTAIDRAIEALLNGTVSSYSIGSRSVTKLDLGDLFEERRHLLRQVERESGGSIRLAKMQRTSR